MTALEEMKALEAQATLPEVKALLQSGIDKAEADAKSLLERVEAHFATAEADIQAWWTTVKAKL